MTVERRINPVSGLFEIWWSEEQRKIVDEHPLAAPGNSELDEEFAVCWAYGRTLGNVNVRIRENLSQFSSKRGENVQLPCDFVYAGKYRHGADRWWCRTHQCHWGVKTDISELRVSGQFRCAGYSEAMSYLVAPFTIKLDEHAESGVWCSLPAALATVEIKARPPKIHVHVRETTGAIKCIDRDFPAISVIYGDNEGLFSIGEFKRVDITPPAAFDFVCALEAQQDLGCVSCPRCGHPHLDLGDFGKTPHRKHFCANCGRDSTWSKDPIISTPLKPLHDRYSNGPNCVVPDRHLNLDQYRGFNYAIWASTPAIVWTAARPQEYGIHVHVHDGTERIIDDTFGEVILNGKSLVREELLEKMIQRTLV